MADKITITTTIKVHFHDANKSEIFNTKEWSEIFADLRASTHCDINDMEKFVSDTNQQLDRIIKMNQTP